MIDFGGSWEDGQEGKQRRQAHMTSADMGHRTFNGMGHMDMLCATAVCYCMCYCMCYCCVLLLCATAVCYTAVCYCCVLLPCATAVCYCCVLLLCATAVCYCCVLLLCATAAVSYTHLRAHET